MPDQPSARPLTQYAPLPTGDKALLTYEAMDNSDDIVLLLE
ncbi:MAG: hypothetical protein QOH05_40, partial [Acetobacteraceae bacterium]|nr:hypothetical protein [Acetobacteraceae bacterium]